MEVLTISELAVLLKMSKKQIYKSTRCAKHEHTQRTIQDHPLPVLKINGNLRFVKADIEAWLAKPEDRNEDSGAPL